MCDTGYVSPAASRSGLGLFGKNSDRKPEEPQHFLLVGRRTPSTESRISGGRILPVPDAGFPCALSVPSWIWGAEMGVNGYGVAIGNEAVFGREAVDKNGVLGMDILRLALQSSRTAAEAADFIVAFIEKWGQGGNGAYKGKLYYQNSFLIADSSHGLILETMGRRWVLRKAGASASISNAYTVRTDFDRADPLTREALSPPQKGRGPRDRGWKGLVENRFYSFFSRGDTRCRFSGSYLESRAGSITAQTLFSLLREHNTFSPARPNRRNMESLCVHGGGLLNNATTASMVVEYLAPDPGRQPGPASPVAVVWYTGTSYPCISLYKPIILENGEFTPLCLSCTGEGAAEAAASLWAEQYRRIRMGAGRLSLLPGFIAERDRLQNEMYESVEIYRSGKTEEGIRQATAAAERFETLLDGFLR